MSDQNPAFISDPANISDRLRNTMNIKARDHRSVDFSQLLLSVLNPRRYPLPGFNK